MPRICVHRPSCACFQDGALRSLAGNRTPGKPGCNSMISAGSIPQGTNGLPERLLVGTWVHNMTPFVSFPLPYFFLRCFWKDGVDLYGDIMKWDGRQTLWFPKSTPGRPACGQPKNAWPQTHFIGPGDGIGIFSLVIPLEMKSRTRSEPDSTPKRVRQQPAAFIFSKRGLSTTSTRLEQVQLTLTPRRKISSQIA